MGQTVVAHQVGNYMHM